MNRSTLIAGVACLALLGPANLFAQSPAVPQPGPEVQKLDYFVGEWTFEGENKASAFGPAGKFSGTETCEWFTGRFQVMCRSAATGPTGKVLALSVYAYDPEAKEYTLYAIDSSGFNVLAHGTSNGDTWTWNWTGTVGGKPAKIQATMQTSKGYFTGTTEGSVGGGPMGLIADLKETRVK